MNNETKWKLKADSPIGNKGDEFVDDYWEGKGIWLRPLTKGNTVKYLFKDNLTDFDKWFEKVEMNYYDEFIQETSLMLHLLWEDSGCYKICERDHVLESVARDYFENKKVREMLTVVDGKCLNKAKLDVRVVAKSYIQHFIKEFNFKPVKFKK